MSPRAPQTGPVLHGGPGRSASAPRSAHRPASRPLARAGTPLAVGGLVLAGVGYLAVTDPYRPGSHLACPVLMLTGWYCAGCGGQRAVHSLAHGDLAAAWDMNPLLVLLVPVAVVAWVRWLDRRTRSRLGAVVRWAPPAGGAPAAEPSPAVSAALAPVRAPWVLLGVVAVFAVLRNVPLLAPWLAP